MVLSALFPHYFRILEIGFPVFEIAFFHFRNAEINIKVAEIAKIAEILQIMLNKDCPIKIVLCIALVEYTVYIHVNYNHNFVR